MQGFLLHVNDCVIDLGCIDGVGETLQVVLVLSISLLVVIEGDVVKQIGTVFVVAVAFVGGTEIPPTSHGDGKDVGWGVALGCVKPFGFDAV